MNGRGQYLIRRRLLLQFLTIPSIFLTYSCIQAASVILQRTPGHREDDPRYLLRL